MSGAQFWRIAAPARHALILRRWPPEHPSPERLRSSTPCSATPPRVACEFPASPCYDADRPIVRLTRRPLWELAPWMPGVADYERSPSTKKLRAAMTSHSPNSTSPSPTSRPAQPTLAAGCKRPPSPPPYSPPRANARRHQQNSRAITDTPGPTSPRSPANSSPHCPTPSRRPSPSSNRSRK